ncbi:MAG: HupE/UreJ family protein [Bacteroidetes bacterium]|nr:MAG: HupE/UreJ family protein [Bacteroidota bacterium]
MKVFKVIFFLFIIPITLAAHEVRPAYFSITQTTDSTYHVVWKLPALGDAIPKIYPTLPNSWQVISDNSNLLPGNLRRTYSILIKEDISGANLYFEGLEKTLIDVLVSIKLIDGVQYSSMIKPANPTYIIPTAPDKLNVIKTYLTLGVNHILSGIDHLLFVLALLLITKGFRKLVMTITAFTIAHSITLTLATLGVVGLPGAPVEAVIALSIVFLAVELVHNYNGREGLTVLYPWVVAFTFGLLHGFGFAGALAEVGLPQADIPSALFFFNVGVELGQLAFVLAVLTILWVLKRVKLNFPVKAKWVAPYVIGGLASFWLIERVMNFF